MKSFSLIRTNVALTTNVKIMIQGNYALSLESIDSEPTLSSSKYKNFKFNKDTYYDEVLPSFYTNLPNMTAFKVKNNGDKDIMFDNFENQYDDIYQSGCRNITNNKAYSEEFECFAPLHIGNTLPKFFLIFRIDGPGITNLSKDNFRTEILDKLKCVKLFNLTTASPLGEWLNNNFIENPYKPDYPLYIDFRNLEFSNWKGIDYEVGGWVSKSVFLESTLEFENTFFDLEKTIIDGYRDNKVVYPNMLNLSFLFDDTPATPDNLRKWSLNRYMGFYIDDLALVSSYSPYSLKQIKIDTVVRPGNILSSPSSANPFEKDWDEKNITYLEVDGVYYTVERYFRETSPSETKIQINTDIYSDEVIKGKTYFYKIISNKDFTGLTYSSINSNTIEIDSDTVGYYLMRSNQLDLIPLWDDADVWIVKIDNVYHKITKKGGKYYLNTDYGFELGENTLKYWINKSNLDFTTQIFLDINNPNLKFSIYKLNFTEIKDFDSSIVDTKFSRYEYEQELSITPTIQPKLYATDFRVNVSPKPINEYYVENNLVNVPCSSEYMANGELFRLVDNNLSDLWNKNPVRVKWCFDSSLSANDYPYLLNNSFVADDFNNTTNPFSLTPRRWDRNLDYFYTINSSTSSYVYHSLHIESFTGSSNNLDTSFKFDLNEYLGTQKDYFTWFFGKSASFVNGNNILSTKKWSNFQKGDKIAPNTTIFRGLKFDIHDILDIKLANGNISNINYTNRNTFDDWKFSILASTNNLRISASESNSSIGFTESTSNQMGWYRIDSWKYSYQYYPDDLVMYQNLIWRALSTSNIIDPSKSPAISSEWLPVTESAVFTPNGITIGSFSSTYSVFWNPLKTYKSNDFVFYNEDYYYYEPTGSSHSFWYPRTVYGDGDFVIYNDKIWSSATAGNYFQPDSSNLKNDYLTSDKPYYWQEVIGSNPTDWKLIELWSSNYIYSTNSITKSNFAKVLLPGKPYCIWNDVLYQLTSATASGESPDISNSWTRLYSFYQDTNFVYSQAKNPIIKMNGSYYYCVSNPNSDTLENGIAIYIHKKWKNILINLFVNDNTLPNLSNCNRDLIYKDLYSNLTAANLFAALSDLSKKYGFSDYIRYVVINENGTLNTYNFSNISSLPYLIIPQIPDSLYSRYESLIKKGVTLEENLIKPQRRLDGRKIETIDQLNYYNGNNLATTIERNKQETEVIANYHGLENKIYNIMWRYSGNYSPLFYEIPLFKRGLFTDTQRGNYLFDTQLSDFGMMKERISSKVNRAGNVLKLRNKPDLKSVYPMLDEFGYHYTDFFIFKSTWDIEYYMECLDLLQSDIPVLLTNKIIKFE